MKLWYTFLRDLKVSFRTYYIYIEIFIALLFVAIVIFVIPENYTTVQDTYILVEESSLREEILDRLSSEEGNLIVVESRDALNTSLEEDRSASGLVVTMADGKLNYEVVLQGYEGERVKNIVEIALLEVFKEEHPQYVDSTSVETMEARSEKLPIKVNMLPVFLLLNSSFVGLFIVAAYIFIDKEEGTIRALTVTPVRIRDYLLSKMGVLLIMGTITGLLTTLLIAGTNANYLHLIVLLIATNIFGTSLGLFIASLYDSLIKAMGGIILMMLTLAFASVSYYLPSFSPAFIKVLPSYPMIYAFREAFMEQPDLSYLYLVAAGSALLGILIFMLAVQRYKKTLTVEGGSM